VACGYGNEDIDDDAWTDGVDGPGSAAEGTAEALEVGGILEAEGAGEVDWMKGAAGAEVYPPEAGPGWAEPYPPEAAPGWPLLPGGGGAPGGNPAEVKRGPLKL
jgi:hypothetical protein